MGRGVAEGLAAIVDSVDSLRGAVVAHCTSNLFPPLTRHEAGAVCFAVELLGGTLAQDPRLADLVTPENRQLSLRLANDLHLWPFVAAAQRLAGDDLDGLEDRLADAEEVADYWPQDDLDE